MNRHLRLFCVYESKHQTSTAESVVSIGLIYMDKAIVFRFFSFISIIALGSSNAFSESLADQMLGTWDFAIDGGYHVTFLKNGTVYAKGTYSDYDGFWTVVDKKFKFTQIKTTGINPIRVNNTFSDKIYDISGKEIKSLKPGINITKGLKIFVP